MSSEILAYLQPYNAQSIEAKNIPFPIQAQGNPHSLLIIPDENIAEMMEDTLEEYDSLTDYVDQQLTQVEQMNVLDTFRTLVSHQLLYTDIADQSEQVKSMDWTSLYHTYSRLWEGQPLLDESLIHRPVHSLVPDLQAMSEQAEEWIQLPLPASKEYIAPLMVPMGGFNECPAPLFQASLFKYWQDKFAAIPLVVGESMWVLHTSTKPQTDEEALLLAQEHFIFCSYVLESFDSIGEYAKYLQQQEFWYFWWD